MTELAVAADDVTAARERISDHIRHTEIRLLPSLGLSVKMEQTQVTGSFKVRGATNVVRALQPQGIVTGSSGNHGTAVAHAARKAGTPRAVVVMGSDFSIYKRARIERLGAEVVDSSWGNSERDALAAQLAREQGLEYVSSYDHPLVIAGQGTMGLEIAEDMPNLGSVFLPVGGGGLAAGVATAVRAATTGVRIIGVEPTTADDTLQSLRAGRRVSTDPPDTICDGVRAQTPGKLTFPIVQALVDDIVTVDDAAVTEAMYLLWREGLSIEPSAALSVAGARSLGVGAGTVCILSGGNVAPEVLSELIRPWVNAEAAGPSP